MPKSSNLTPKQARFVQEYLIDLNATQAAIRAGYSAKTANEQAARLLAKASVQAAVAEGQEAKSRHLGVTVERVLEEMAVMGLYDAGEVGAHAASGPKDIQHFPEHLRRAVVGWGWDRAGNFTLKLANKATALDQLAKHLGMYIERHEHTGKAGGPIETTGADLSGLTRDQLAQLESLLAAARSGEEGTGAEKPGRLH